MKRARTEIHMEKEPEIQENIKEGEIARKYTHGGEGHLCAKLSGGKKKKKENFKNILTMFRELTENKNKEKEIKKPSIQNQNQHLKPPGSDPTQPPSPSQIKEIVEKFENIKGNEHLKMKRPIFKKPEKFI